MSEMIFIWFRTTKIYVYDGYRYQQKRYFGEGTGAGEGAIDQRSSRSHGAVKIVACKCRMTGCQD